MLLCLGEPPVRFLWCWLSFLFFILLLYLHFVFFLHLSFFFIHIFLFGIIPHLSMDYRRVFTPILYFWLSPPRSDSWHFHFQPFHYLLAASHAVLSGPFLPIGIFTLPSFTDVLTCVYQGFPGRQQFFLEVCRASYWSSKHRPGPSVCLIHSNPQSSYSKWFSFKFYHILSWIACDETLIYLLITCFKLFLLVRSICKTIKKHFEQD